MKSSNPQTLNPALGATTLSNGLFTSTPAASRKAANARKPGFSKMACIVSLFCVATAMVSAAQTKFTSLFSFDGKNGADPHYVTLVQGLDGNLYGTTYAGTGDGGQIFKISTSGALATLYTFCPSGYPCPNGSQPDAGLVLATNGNFYGTTMNGGANNDGTVYQVTSSGNLTTLHSFDSTDGAEPETALMQASNGYLYGTTTIGGTGGVGTIFQISTSGALTSLHSFDTSDGVYPDSSLVQGTNGNLYGTTYEGGGGTGTIYDITTAGALSTLYTFNPTTGGGATGTLIQASNGNFYGTTSGGGEPDQGTIFEITPKGKFTLLYTFCLKSGCPDGSTPNAGLIQGTDGNLYGTTFAGGANNSCADGGCGTIFEITTTGKFTTLYNFCSQSNCADGSAPQGGLVQDTNGNFYGATYYGGTDGIGAIYSLSTGLGPFVKTLQGSGAVGSSVIILGTNLTGASKVSFDGVAATFKVVSSSEITATVPASATTGTVTVVTKSGTLKSNVPFTVTE